MRRIERGGTESVFGLQGSSIDSNRFYSILLDARASTVSESMYDTAEKLLQGEKENAKIALEQLWSLKKNILGDSSGTIDLLINFYQDKMDILRTKEESIKKISRDSRSLLEDKRKRDEEIASVKQQITDCSRELNELTTKLEKLKIKEQELTLIEGQLKKELTVNENEIVNGLYEIILSQQEREDQQAIDNILQDRPAGERQVSRAEQEPARVVSNESNESIDLLEPLKSEVAPEESPKNESAEETNQIGEETEAHILHASAHAVQEPVPELPPYPKSVVKTTRGRIIGEYFYDGKIYKNERHYIFNSAFFCEQLAAGAKLLRQRFDQAVYAEMLQMIQDAHKRVSESKILHFEVSSNEILNEKTLKQLWQDAKLRSLDEIERFAGRLKAKIDALGANRRPMLQEQMGRCAGN